MLKWHLIKRTVHESKVFGMVYLALCNFSDGKMLHKILLNFFRSLCLSCLLSFKYNFSSDRLKVPVQIKICSLLFICSLYHELSAGAKLNWKIAPSRQLSYTLWRWFVSNRCWLKMGPSTLPSLIEFTLWDVLWRTMECPLSLVEVGEGIYFSVLSPSTHIQIHVSKYRKTC